ncbi:MAG: universal stress protein [Chloroflexi bacterium]|nr:universal stress protein [Chloroflexota bacterium]
MFKKILVCLNGTDLAEQILCFATEIAQRFGSKLVFLEVTIPPSLVVEPTTGYYHATPIDKVKRDEHIARVYLERLAELYRPKGLDVECIVLQGDPGNMIVSYAKETGIDLICLGTHGRRGLGRLVYGSVANTVLRKSNLPILVKKPQEAEKEQTTQP